VLNLYRSSIFLLCILYSSTWSTL